VFSASGLNILVTNTVITIPGCKAIAKTPEFSATTKAWIWRATSLESAYAERDGTTEYAAPLTRLMIMP
jgi:hypothetical protein